MLKANRRTEQRRQYAAVTVEEDQSLRCILAEDDGAEVVIVADESTPLELRSFPVAAEFSAIDEQVKNKLKDVMPAHTKLAGIGISTPGTIDTKTKTLLDVPRRGWKEVPDVIAVLNFKDMFSDWVDDPQKDIIVDNDATMSALGEMWHRTGNRAAVAADDFAYIRAGAGINGAAFINGRPWHGALHPEMGHIMIHEHELDPGRIAPYLCTAHGSCLEGSVGLARLRVLANRNYNNDWSKVDEIAGFYIAQLCYTLALVLAPPRIVIAGATIEEATDPTRLLDCIQKSFTGLVNGYPRNTAFNKADDYITRAVLPAAEASWRGALYAALDPTHPQRRA